MTRITLRRRMGEDGCLGGGFNRSDHRFTRIRRGLDSRSMGARASNGRRRPQICTRKISLFGCWIKIVDNQGERINGHHKKGGSKSKIML